MNRYTFTTEYLGFEYMNKSISVIASEYATAENKVRQILKDTTWQATNFTIRLTEVKELYLDEQAEQKDTTLDSTTK